MASFCCVTDQPHLHKGIWITATEFEPLRMMLLNLLIDHEAQETVDPAFPMELVREHIEPGRCLGKTWHGGSHD